MKKSKTAEEREDWVVVFFFYIYSPPAPSSGQKDLSSIN